MFGPSTTSGRTLLAATCLLFAHTGTASAQPASDDASLYERLGGLPAISLVVSDFVDVFIRDSLILSNPAVRARKTPDAAPYIKFQVTALVCQLTGGPCEYTGRSLKEAHAGLGVSAREWDRMVDLFSETLARHQVPEREQQELFEIVGPARNDIVAEGN